MPPRKPLYILVGMFYNPSEDTLESWREATVMRASEQTRAFTRFPARPRIRQGHPRCI